MSSKFKLCTRGNARISSIFGDNQIIYGNASHDIQDINANLGSIDSRLSSIDGNVFSIELSVT